MALSRGGEAWWRAALFWAASSRLFGWGVFGEVFGGEVGEPGVVGVGEGGAAADGGVGVGPEFVEGAGVGVGEGGLAEDVEGTFGGGLGVGDEAVDGLLSVDVGGVFVVTAEAVGDGFEEEREEGEGEEEDGECGPVGLAGDSPAGAEAGDGPLDEAEAEVEGDEGDEEGEEDALDDVSEDVVTGLVAEDEEDLVGGHFGDGGVPDDDALGVAEAFDVGVELGGFGGGLHEVHAFGGDVHVALFDDAFELGDEGGVGLLEGLVVVEEGFDVWGGEDAEEGDGDGECPEGEPPAAREFADDPEEEHEEEAADDPGEGEALGLVAGPAGPGLDGETVDAGEVLGVEAEGQGEEEVDEGEEEEEGVALDPAVGAEAGGGVADAGDDAEGEEKDEAEDAPSGVDEVEGDVDGVEVLGLGEVGGGEGVVGDVAVAWGGVEFLLGVEVGGVLGGGFGGATGDEGEE